jgi:methylmalonyl-CoA mutase C-terminal domain/subunit
MTILPRMIDLLRKTGADDIILMAGGVMPDEDVAALKKMGIGEVLLQDAPPETIVGTVRRLVAERGSR